MSLDVVDLRDFYGTDLGAVAARLIGAKLRARWSNVAGLRVAGVGFAGPYLSLFRDEAERVLSFNPATQGVLEWPDGGPIAAALVEETELPVADGTIDRVLAIHLLEEADSALETLREIWRVLAPGGTVILVAPNRRGVWARSDATPFGNGRPFSRPQLMRLLRDALFSPVNWTEALYLPPIIHGWALRSAPTYERLAERFAFPFAGVHIVEATKQVYRPITVRAKRIKSRKFRPVLIPSPAGRTGDAALERADER